MPDNPMLATTEGLDAIARLYSQSEVEMIITSAVAVAVRREEDRSQATINGMTNLVSCLVRRLGGETLVTGQEFSELECCVLHMRTDEEANGVRVWVTREGDPNAKPHTARLILPPGVGG